MVSRLQKLVLKELIKKLVNNDSLSFGAFKDGARADIDCEQLSTSQLIEFYHCFDLVSEMSDTVYQHRHLIKVDDL